MIRLDHLTKAFGRHVVLDAVSLVIDAGDRIALIGANGAGKTTLIRCLLGEYVYEGEILVDGRSPRAERCAVLASMGFVPQIAPPLKMPVGELLRFAAGISSTDISHVVDVLMSLGLSLEDVRKKPFVKLSGGQKQKILAAIALARDCGFLILDEPAANLDPAARKVMFELLAERPERPMLISSHRLEEVVGIVNRVIELDRGRIVLDERIASVGTMAHRHSCRMELERADEGIIATLQSWGFAHDVGEKLRWHGAVTSGDRLRFLAALTRYGGLIGALQIDGVESLLQINAGSKQNGEVRDVRDKHP